MEAQGDNNSSNNSTLAGGLSDKVSLDLRYLNERSSSSLVRAWLRAAGWGSVPTRDSSTNKEPLDKLGLGEPGEVQGRLRIREEIPE